MMDPPVHEQTEVDFLARELATTTAALRAIVSLAPRCDEGDCGDVDNCEDAFQEGKHRIVHAVTTLWDLPVYLCAEHAVTRAESHQKAESKGSGKQPEIVPYVEPNAAIGIARLALATLQARTTPQEPQNNPQNKDLPDEWSDRILAAFPTRSGLHEEYGTAMRMVGPRHTKGELVALVNWLLLECKAAQRKAAQAAR